MQKSVKSGRIAALLLELGLVAAAVGAGAYTGNRFRIIPKALIHLPVIKFGADDVRVMLLSSLVGCLVSFLLARLIAGGDVFRSGRRVAIEIYALVAGIVGASLYQFFLTAVNFSPEMLLQTTLFGIALLLIAFLIFGPRTRGAGLGDAILSLFGLLKRPLAWAVILFALTPVFVGRKFANDRDFANWVTRLRVEANVSNDRPYVLVNALGSTTFRRPIMVQFAKSDPRTIYVLTRDGEFWRADYPSGANATKLLDISKQVGYVEMENGALGFDLHPEFGKPGSPNSGFVYIYFTEWHPDRQVNHLTRYDLSQPSPEARLASALPLIEQGRKNDGYHNAGMVAFGPDGMLYLSIGEAASEECHQRIDCNLYGGIFRIDVDNRGGTFSRPILRQPKDGHTANYMIPLDNPWADRGAAALGEYYAMGLRNPFRFGFDPANGQMIAGEVGSTTWEEVNRIEKGGNYQFPYIEGFTAQQKEPRPATIVGTEKPPILTYHHTAFVRSVIGGSFYRATRYPELTGKYIFADNYSGEIYAMPANATRIDKWDTIARESDVAQRGLTAMVPAPDGEILVPVMGEQSRPTGIIARLVPAGSAEAKRAVAASKALAAAEAAKPTTAVSLAEARELWGVNCARCHGPDGRGNGPDSKDLGDYVPNFHDPNFQKWWTDAMILEVLNGGGAAVGRGPMMPPWKDVLKPGEIEGLKNLVREYGKTPEKPQG